MDFWRHRCLGVHEQYSCFVFFLSIRDSEELWVLLYKENEIEFGAHGQSKKENLTSQRNTSINFSRLPHPELSPITKGNACCDEGNRETYIISMQAGTTK
jgi:hypothetical protein